MHMSSEGIYYMIVMYPAADFIWIGFVNCILLLSYWLVHELCFPLLPVNQRTERAEFLLHNSHSISDMSDMPSPVSLDEASIDMHEHPSQALDPSTQQLQSHKNVASAGNYDQSNGPMDESQKASVEQIGQGLSVFLSVSSPLDSDVRAAQLLGS